MSEASAALIINEAAARKKPSFARVSRLIPDQLVSQQLQRVGGGLTPAAVSARLAAADIGEMAPLVDLANALRQKDGHLQGILETRESSVQQLPWELELPQKPTKKEKQAAEFVKDALLETLHVGVAHASSAPFFGYAVSEIGWIKSGKYIVPEKLYPIAPRRFVFRSTRVVWQDKQGQPDVDIAKEYPGRFIISQPRTTGDVPCREGLMRVLVWAALFRNWDLTDWLRLGEIAWKPWRIGKYKRDSFPQQEDIDGLIADLDAMASTGTLVAPDSVDIDVKWPSGAASSGSPHAQMFDTMGREMSKCVLGQTETTESSKTSGYAQAKVQYQVKRDKTEADSRFIAFDHTRDLITPLTRLNFGPTVRPARLRFITEEKAELQPFGLGIQSLAATGLRMSAKWVRSKGGMPDPVEGEETIGGADALQKPGKPTPNDDGDNEEETPEKAA